MTMRGMETVGVRAVIQGLPEYLSGAKAITSANVGITGSLKGLDSITNGFKLLATAVAGVTTVIGGAAIASAAKYETTLTKITALTNTSAEDTAKLGKGLLELARNVPKSPDELGAAAYFALSSGISDVDDALALVTAASKASAAGLGSTADIVDIVTAAINAYGKENLTAADATDILVAAVREGKGEPAEMATALGSLLPLAAALKIPFEDVAAVFASLTNALGGSGGAAQAATQFKGIMSQIISPSKEAKDALAEAEAGIKHMSQTEIDLADAHRAVVSASDAYVSSVRGIRDASEGVTQAQRGVRDASYAVEAAHRDSKTAAENLRNAYADLAQAQRNQQQASIDGRRETLSILEAEQSLTELRTQAGSHSLELASAELALTQAREQASAKGKKSASEQRAADLAVIQAQQRLNTVRSQGGRYALDLANAELRVTEARSRQGTAQARQDKEVAESKKGVVKAQQDVIDSGRNEVKAREGQVDAAKGLRNAEEGVEDAKRQSARAATDLALAQEKEVLAQIHTRDAYADLRKEIAEKGIVPALQRINELFADNQEGLAKLFPDIRGFIGFLSAISSQGDHTAEILAHVHNRLGLTDQAFAAVSKTAEFQAKLFKGQLNVALIELGSVALPKVNEGFAFLAKHIPEISDFFKKGLNGTKIGGDLSTIQTAAFKAGEEIRGLIQFIKDNKDASILPAGASFLSGLKDVAQWFIEHKEAIAAAFVVFAATNPLWAGILAGGVIITAIGILGQDIDGLSDPLLRVRRQIDLTIIRMADLANTFFSFGLNKVPGVKDLIPTVVGSKSADEDLKLVDAELAKRKKANADAAEAARQLKQAQEEALKAGVPYVEFLRSQIEAYIASGGTKMDEFLDRLLSAYEKLPGSDKGFIQNTRDGLREAVPAAAELATNLALVNPPQIGDAGRSQLDAATEASLQLGGSISAITPPNTGDGGEKALENATAAAQGEKVAIDSIRPPNVADAGKGAIDNATGSAGALGRALGGIRPPNVGDAGRYAIDQATRAALSLAAALGTAAAAAQRVGTGLGTAAGGATRRAEGGIVTKPEITLMGEGSKPEAVLPLTNPRRSREILGGLPKPMIRNLFPVQAFEDGGTTGTLGYSANIASKPLTGQLLWDRFLSFGLNRGPGLQNITGGTSGSGGGGGGESVPIGGGGSGLQQYFSGSGGGGGGGFGGGAYFAPNPNASIGGSKQVYATLTPSMIRSAGGGATRTPNAPISFDSLFGEINIGSTSREVEEITVKTVRAVFAQARTGTAIGGGVMSSGFG